MKVCSKCGIYKDYLAFCKDRTRPDGLEPRCRQCRKTANALSIYPVGTKKCTKCRLILPFISFAISKDKKSSYTSHCKSCFKHYKDTIWYPKNKAQVSAQQRGYYEENKEKVSKRHKAYKAKNKHKVAALSAKRKALELQATPPWLTKAHFAEIELFYKQARTMSEFHETPYHVDHIYPLQGKNSCGLHIPSNLRVIPAFDNLSKGNKILPELELGL